MGNALSHLRARARSALQKATFVFQRPVIICIKLIVRWLAGGGGWGLCHVRFLPRQMRTTGESEDNMAVLTGRALHVLSPSSHIPQNLHVSFNDMQPLKISFVFTGIKS